MKSVYDNLSPGAFAAIQAYQDFGPEMPLGGRQVIESIYDRLQDPNRTPAIQEESLTADVNLRTESAAILKRHLPPTSVQIERPSVSGGGFYPKPQVAQTDATPTQPKQVRAIPFAELFSDESLGG